MQRPESSPERKTLTAKDYRNRLSEFSEWSDKVPMNRIQATADGVRYKATDVFFVGVRNLFDVIVDSQPGWLQDQDKQQFTEWSQEITEMLEQMNIQSYVESTTESPLIEESLSSELKAQIRSKISELLKDSKIKLSDIPNLVINDFSPDQRGVAAIYFLRHHLVPRMPKVGIVPEDLRGLRSEQIRRLNEIILRAVQILE